MKEPEVKKTTIPRYLVKALNDCLQHFMFNSPPGDRGKIWTHDFIIRSSIFYHCVTSARKQYVELINS